MLPEELAALARDAHGPGEDPCWGAGVLLAAALTLAMLPFVPILWLIGRIDS